MNLLKRLYIFQKERFPLRILIFTTLSSVLASAAVVPAEVTFYPKATAFLIVMLFLFHIRAIDESRDLKLDNKLHADRSVQRGIVSVKLLLTLSFTGLGIAFVLAYLSNLPSFLLVAVFTAFTFFAWHDFFIPEYFKNNPVLYHLVNSPQMLITQWLIYTLFTGTFQLSQSMILFLVLTYITIFLLEVTRKTEVPLFDSGDTYSACMGLNKVFIFQLVFVFISILFSIVIISLSGIQNYLSYGILIFLGFLVVFVFWKFRSSPGTKTQKLCELMAVLFYIGVNLILFWTL